MVSWMVMLKALALLRHPDLLCVGNLHRRCTVLSIICRHAWDILGFSFLRKSMRLYLGVSGVGIDKIYIVAALNVDIDYYSNANFPQYAGRMASGFFKIRVST